MKRYILALLLVCIPAAAYAITQAFTITVAINALTPVFTCNSGFAATGACSTGFIGSGSGFAFKVGGTSGGATPGFSGSAVNLVPANSNHVALNMNYQTLVSAQQFSTTFTYVPNGVNISFILNNSNNGTFNGASFSGGAGCEGGFFQGFTGGAGPPNNVFALLIGQTESLTGGGNPTGNADFEYSNVQYYDAGHRAAGTTPSAIPPGQSPCNPDLGGDGTWTYVGVNKISTSPVALNSPPATPGITTGHTYSATISYDGSNLTISLFDVTAGGACPGAACFTNTWTGVSIPTIVGGNTAWVGLGSGTGSGGYYIPPVPLLINTWSFSQ